MRTNEYMPKSQKFQVETLKRKKLFLSFFCIKYKKSFIVYFLCETIKYCTLKSPSHILYILRNDHD